MWEVNLDTLSFNAIDIWSFEKESTPMHQVVIKPSICSKKYGDIALTPNHIFMQWMKETIKGKMYVDTTMNNHELYDHNILTFNVFYFVNPEEALICKMMWS